MIAYLTGCEIDPDYFAAAVKRVEQDTRQMNLFTENAEVCQPSGENRS